jgi:hypothetical protein
MIIRKKFYTPQIQGVTLSLSNALSVEKRTLCPQLQSQTTNSLAKHSRPFAFNAHYVLRKVANGKVKVTFLGPPSKSRPRQIWVVKSLIEKVTGPMQNRALKIEA